MTIPKKQQKRAESGVFRAADMTALLNANINPAWLSSIAEAAKTNSNDVAGFITTKKLALYGINEPTSYQSNFSLRKFITEVDDVINNKRDFAKKLSPHNPQYAFFFLMYGLQPHDFSQWNKFAPEAVQLLYNGLSANQITPVVTVMHKEGSIDLMLAISLLGY